MSLIYPQILGPLVLGWAPKHFVLGAQLAPGEKSLVCIPELNLAYVQISKRFECKIVNYFLTVTHQFKHVFLVLKRTIS